MTFFGQEYINANDVMAFCVHLICLISLRCLGGFTTLIGFRSIMSYFLFKIECKFYFLFPPFSLVSTTSVQQDSRCHLTICSVRSKVCCISVVLEERLVWVN